MTDHPLSQLPDRGKEPNSKRTLDTWIQQAQNKTGVGAGRLSWMVASAVVVAVLQRPVNDAGRPRFLLKGGTYLELRLGTASRSTSDVDGLYRGQFDDLIEHVDKALAQPWGPLTFERTAPQRIERAARVVKPLRFTVKVKLRGQTWRSVDVEVAPDEGQAAAGEEVIASPRLDHFGLPSPNTLVGIAMDYQVAQKLHACTDPHAPPEFVNDRVRDVVDLLLIRDAFYADNDVRELAAVCRTLFASRAREAETLGAPPRSWPPVVTPNALWARDYAREAEKVGLGRPLEDAVEQVNRWITQIDAS